MNKWAIQLKGHQLDLQYLFDNQIDQEWSISKDDDEYYLCSNSFSEMENDIEAENEGENILKILNGSAFLAENNYEPVLRGPTCILDKDGKLIKRFIYFKGSARLGFGGSVIMSGGVDAPKSNPVNTRFTLSKTNSNFSDALQIFGKGIKNLVLSDLYNIIELLEDTGDKERVLDEFDAGFRKEISNLELVCQSHKAIGEEARHRKRKYDKHFEESKIALKDKAEYIELIRQLLAKWADT